MHCLSWVTFEAMHTCSPSRPYAWKSLLTRCLRARLWGCYPVLPACNVHLHLEQSHSVYERNPAPRKSYA